MLNIVSNQGWARTYIHRRESPLSRLFAPLASIVLMCYSGGQISGPFSASCPSQLLALVLAALGNAAKTLATHTMQQKLH